MLVYGTSGRSALAIGAPIHHVDDGSAAYPLGLVLTAAYPLGLA